MFGFSNDRDLMIYEPAFFRDLHFTSQVLAKGVAAVINDTTLTKTGEDFISKGILPGCVIHLADTAAGVDNLYEIVDILSPTQLKLSILRSADTDNAIPLPSMAAADYRVCSYQPQSVAVRFELTQYFGIQPGNPSSKYTIDDLLDESVLRQVSAFAVLCRLFTTIADSTDAAENYWEKSFYYQKLFEKARDRCRVDIDLGDDGTMDLTRYAATPKLMRD